MNLRPLLVVLFLASAFACTGTEHRLRLGQISTGLRPFENSPYDALTTKEVHYSAIGEDEYDTFFREAAAVHGSLLFAVHAIDRAERIVAGEVDPTSLDFRIMWTVVTDTLPRTKRRALYLYTEARRLRGKLAGDFWWRPHKYFPVRSAVDEARENLLAARELVPSLEERLKRIHRKIDVRKILQQSL